jgi:predicted Rossmann-fold nucleotide-binding protein
MPIVKRPKAPRRVVCVGRRDPTHEERELCSRIGGHLAGRGFIVVTGNANGADQAFAAGANAVDPRLVELHIPWRGHNQGNVHPENAVIELSAEKPTGRDAVARALHSRNQSMIRSGPVQVVALPRRKEGAPTGGTAHTMRLARGARVEVIDLTTEEGRRRVLDKLGKKAD